MKKVVAKVKEVAEGLGWIVKIHPQDQDGNVEIEIGDTDETFVVKVSELSLLDDVADDIREIANIAQDIYNSERLGRVYNDVENYLDAMIRLEKALRESKVCC